MVRRCSRDLERCEWGMPVSVAKSSGAGSRRCTVGLYFEDLVEDVEGFGELEGAVRHEGLDERFVCVWERFHRGV